MDEANTPSRSAKSPDIRPSDSRLPPGSGTADPLRVPRYIAEAIDRACERDREFFEQHPTARGYERPVEPEEFWPHPVPAGTAVRVQRVLHGRADVRTRALIERHSADDLRAALDDPRVTIFVARGDGTSWEPSEEDADDGHRC